LITDITRSIISLILINLKFAFNVSKKKTIVFNFPREQVAKKDINYIEDLFKDLEKFFFIVYVHKIKDPKFNLKNKYFMQQYLLKFILNADYFVSNYISDFFPQQTKKIYIHHCITDCPLTNKKKDYEIAARFSKYDFILINSIYVKNYFEEIINKYCKKFSKENITNIIDVGYPRIDFLIKRLNQKKRSKNNEKSIIIAPANFIAFKKFSLINNLEFLIDCLLKFTKFRVIFRPHPQNRKNILSDDNKFNDKFNFLSKYKNNKKFLFDTSDDYLKNYLGSKIMISDLSGTAFTFSFLTNNPVLFYSLNEREYTKIYKKFEHFKLRYKIGKVCYNKKLVLKNIKELIQNKRKISLNIQNEKKRLKKFSFAKKNISIFFKDNL